MFGNKAIGHRRRFKITRIITGRRNGLYGWYERSAVCELYAIHDGDLSVIFHISPKESPPHAFPAVLRVTINLHPDKGVIVWVYVLAPWRNECLSQFKSNEFNAGRP